MMIFNIGENKMAKRIIAVIVMLFSVKMKWINKEAAWA